MTKERMALGLIAFGAVLSMVIYGFQMLTENRLARVVDTFEPPAWMERYKRLAAANRAMDEPLLPDDAPVAVDSFDEPYARDTMARYKAHFDLYDETFDRYTWTQLRNRLDMMNFREWTDSDLRALDTLLAEKHGLILELRALAKRGGPVYPLDFSEGFAKELPHLPKMQDFARLLSLNAMANARAGNYEEAVKDIVAGLQLAGALAGEPVLISQSVRVAMTGTIVSAVENSFDWGELPTGLAEEIMRQAARSDHRDALTDALRAERQTMLNYWTEVESDGSTLVMDSFGNSVPDRIAAMVVTSPFMRPWRNLDMAEYGDLMERGIEASELAYHEAIPALLAISDDFGNLSFMRISTPLLIPNFRVFHIAQARMEAQLDLLQIGLALESYNVEYGEYPASLDAVASVISGGLPVDPYTGEWYHYENRGAAFLLYSVGPNMVDDGGVHDPNQGDIVWRGEQKRTNLTPGEKNVVASAQLNWRLGYSQ